MEEHRKSNMEVIRDSNVKDNKVSHGKSHEEHEMEANRESDMTEGRRKLKLTPGEQGRTETWQVHENCLH